MNHGTNRLRAGRASIDLANAMTSEESPRWAFAVRSPQFMSLAWPVVAMLGTLNLSTNDGTGLWQTLRIAKRLREIEVKRHPEQSEGSSESNGLLDSSLRSE